MIGQTIVNVRRMGKGRPRLGSCRRTGITTLVTGLKRSDGRNTHVGAGGNYGDCGGKTFSWHSIQPTATEETPVTETLVMLVTVAATVSTGNGDWRGCRGDGAMLILPRIVKANARLHQKQRCQTEK